MSRGVKGPKYYKRYVAHKHRAADRGIDFMLTFEEWLAVWGDKIDLAGCRRDDFVMARTGDVGPYAVGNVRITTARDNHLERGSRPQSPDERAKRAATIRAQWAKVPAPEREARTAPARAKTVRVGHRYRAAP